MQKLKKILIYAVGGVVGLFVLLIIASMFMDTSSLPAMDDDSASLSDPKLEKLRQRESELNEVYEGEDDAFLTPDSSDDLYADVGELTDFDAPASSEVEAPAKNTLSPAPMVAEEPATAASANRSPAEKNPDVVVADLLNKPQPTTMDGDQSRSAPASLVEQQELALKVELLGEQTRRDIGEIQDTLSALSERPALGSEILNGIQDSLNTLLASQASMKDKNNAMAQEMASLSARIEDLEAQKKRAARARKPSASPSMLRSLYHLERIQGGTAVLIGQNTGTRYSVAQGDSLAYGGRVAAIQGDRVTLRWPNVTTTLSIY